MLLIVCGPPGSGKTTIATRLRERLAERGREFDVVHSDEFSRRTYEQMYDRVADAGGDWILDGTFYRREWREPFYALDDAVVAAVTADIETCLARNRARADPIDERGVYVVYHEFEEPDADAVLDTDELDVEESVSRILAALAARERGEEA